MALSSLFLESSDFPAPTFLITTMNNHFCSVKDQEILVHYLCKSIQNELMQILAGAIKKHILTYANSANCYSVMLATNERQDDGVGILHEVAQFPIDQVYLYIQGAHAPLLPCKTQRGKVLAAKQVGLYVPPDPHALLKEAVETCGW